MSLFQVKMISVKLANEATDNTKIKQVHVDGVLAGERGIGGLLAKADQSSITESSFKGRIVNTYETTVDTILVVWSVI